MTNELPNALVLTGGHLQLWTYLSFAFVLGILTWGMIRALIRRSKEKNQKENLPIETHVFRVTDDKTFFMLAARYYDMLMKSDGTKTARVEFWDHIGTKVDKILSDDYNARVNWKSSIMFEIIITETKLK